MWLHICMNDLKGQIFKIITENAPLTTKEIQDSLQDYSITVSREQINSILYGELRDSIIRDVNTKGIPAWKVRQTKFSAAGGLEAKLYQELIKRNIISTDNSQLGFTLRNTRNGKTYHLDIAIRQADKRFNIEIDGFDHVRADALSSLERQIIENGNNAEIEIDWMDNEKSYIRYDEINTKLVYQWLGEHIDWCIRFHEELLWPKDITRNLWLIDKGWVVVRFWNIQVRNRVNQCLKDIEDILKK